MTELKPATHLSSRASKVQKVVADCGVEAWLVEDYAVPVVALDVAFKGGATQDPAGKAGAATMFAGLLDEGAGTLDSEAFRRALDDRAIELSFSADRDIVTAHLRTLAQHAGPAFDLLRLCLCEPRFDEDAVERVRGQLGAGLRREMNEPDSVAARLFRAQGFAGHPYGLPGRGDLDSVSRVARADFPAMQGAVLARDNVKLAAVGAIDAATLKRHLDAIFAPLPAHARLAAAPATALQGLGSRHIADLDLSQSTIRFGRPGIARHDPDFIAAMVVNHILGGGVFTARLFSEVREKRGLAYTVYSQMASYDHANVLMGSTSTKNERALEALEVIQGEIRALGRDGPTEEELDKARKYLTGSYALRFDTSAKIAGQLVQLQLDGFGVEFLDQRNRLVEAVTLEDATRAAARLLGDGELLVAVAGRPAGM